MKYDPMKHKWRSIRLGGYNYSAPGAYFITDPQLYSQQPSNLGTIPTAFLKMAMPIPKNPVDQMKVNHSHPVPWLVCFVAIALSCCANPVTETYKKGVDGGEKAIDNARGVQQTVDQTKVNLEQQAKEAEGTPQSP